MTVFWFVSPQIPSFAPFCKSHLRRSIGVIRIRAWEPPLMDNRRSLKHRSVRFKIPDPLLVLFDRYERTSNANIKQDQLQSCVMRFRTCEKKATGDDEFVRQSKQWYLQNHAKFELTPYYHPRSSFPADRNYSSTRLNTSLVK